MPASHRLYRSLVCLYPKDFRSSYRDDLVQHFDDLVTDRGAAAAWTRTGLDLLITVPRYRLENIMNERRSTTAITVLIGLFVAGGLASFLTGMYPGAVLLAVAVALAVAQRSALAQAIRTPDSDRRRHRLRISAVLGAVFVASYIAYINLIGDTWTLRDTVLALTGTIAMFGAFGYLVIGLLTPKHEAGAALPSAR